MQGQSGYHAFMLGFWLDFLFPRRSLSGEIGLAITDDEKAALRPEPVLLPRETLRSLGLTSLDAVYAALPYHRSPLIARAVHAVKYRRQRLLCDVLIDSMAAAAPAVLDEAVLCPVPLHWSRQFARGFNQSELLAAGLAERTGRPIETLVRRRRATGHQAHRKRTDRLVSMERAFCSATDVPSVVILVDDVFTTGATLDACAAVLKQSGASTVVGWVFARS